MILHDQHVHTCYSFDSNEPIENYVQEAINRGCKYFVTTEHFEINTCNTHRDLIFDLQKERKELTNLGIKYPNIKLLFGIEIGYKNLKKDNDRLKKELKPYIFDLINLSIHDYDDIDFYVIDDFDKNGVTNTLNIYFNQMLKAVKEVDDFDVLSHIDYGFKTPYLKNKNLKISQFEPILREIFLELIKKDKTLEINTKVQDAIDDKDHLPYLLKLYKECGGKNLSLSSDAHKLNRYMINFDKYINIIKELGFDYLVYYINRKKNYFKI